MIKQKYYLFLNDQERRFVIESLNQLRNKLIVDGKYTDAVDEVLIKIIGAKQKNFKVQSMTFSTGHPVSHGRFPPTM